MNVFFPRLLAHERIRAARHHIERTDGVPLARQAALSAIPAPTGAEGRRAARVAELFREIGLSDVAVDRQATYTDGWARTGGGRRETAVRWCSPRVSTRCSGRMWTSPWSGAGPGATRGRRSASPTRRTR